MLQLLVKSDLWIG